MTRRDEERRGEPSPQPPPSGVAREAATTPSSLRLFEALVRRSHDAVTLLSHAGMVLYANQACQRVLGSAPDQLYASAPILNRLHSLDRDRAEAAIAALRTQQDASSTDVVRFRHGDGGWRWIEMTSSNLLDEPEVHAIVVTFRDVSERVRQQHADRARIRNTEQLAAALTAIGAA